MRRERVFQRSGAPAGTRAPGDGTVCARAVILPGGAGLRTWNPGLRAAVGSLPMAGCSLLAEQCRWLGSHGIDDVLVALSGPPGEWPGPEPPAKLGDVRLQWLRRLRKVGTADCMRDVAEFIGTAPFLVLSPNLAPCDLDLRPLLRAPMRNGTLIRMRAEPPAASCEREISLEGDVVRRFSPRHFSRDRRRAALSLDVFLCSPQVLEHVPESGYFDLKEQLVPAVQTAGFEVRVVFSETPAILVRDAADYLSALAESLSRRQPEPGDREIDSGIWARGDVEISRSATLVGPLLIDHGVVIHEAAQVVGPTYLGPGVHIGKGARVRQASLWPGSRVADGGQIAFSVLAEHQEVGAGETLACAVRCGSDESLGRPAALCRPSAPARAPSRRRAAESPFYPLLKRLLDLVLAGVGGLLSLPLCALIAIAVRLDSKGPVLYRQPRCGRFGREFLMLKFRTMRPGADAQQAQEQSGSERQGPIYKRTTDPRVTRLGCWLRRTSLDELPQLWNILEGDMSIVGPRPLKIDEMKYSPQWRDLRLSVKPGLTGLWQVNARTGRDFESWIHHDTDYALSPGSLSRDLVILTKTVWRWTRGKLPGE